MHYIYTWCHITGCSIQKLRETAFMSAGHPWILTAMYCFCFFFYFNHTRIGFKHAQEGWYLLWEYLISSFGHPHSFSVHYFFPEPAALSVVCCPCSSLQTTQSTGQTITPKGPFVPEGMTQGICTLQTACGADLVYSESRSIICHSDVIQTQNMLRKPAYNIYIFSVSKRDNKINLPTAYIPRIIGELREIIHYWTGLFQQDESFWMCF